LPLSDVLSIVIDSFTSATERHIEVGDGLEIYIVLARDRDLGDLEVVRARNVGLTQEVTVTDDGERVFVLRLDLKKD